MTERFSLKDHLFNSDTLGQLAAEYAAGLPGFSAQSFLDVVLPGLPSRELKERIDWIADCLEPHLATDFPAMADQIEAAMPPPLDPTKTDDDFGKFIHAVPGVLTVRHGMEERYLPRALDLLEAATQRFSMEFYIRPFLNTFPDPVMERLWDWANHDNYHVRRLVSEGTRAKLPWATALTLDPMTMAQFLDALHADPTRYVTRSVANHMNDLSKIDPDAILGSLQAWRAVGQQQTKELDWMTAHSLRTLVKDGHPKAMEMLGYRPDAPVTVAAFGFDTTTPAIGDKVKISASLTAPEKTPVLVDYVIWFKRPGGSESAKVHKLKQAVIQPGKLLTLAKAHVFKGNATTYSLVPGPHRMALQVNGRIAAETVFDLQPAP